jgi:hypothetical protein
MEKLDVLQRNGFEVAVSVGEETTELVLVAQPVSKSTVFDMQGAFHFLIPVPFPAPVRFPQDYTVLTCHASCWVLRPRGTGLPSA